MSTALAAGDAATTTLKDTLSTSQDFPQYPGDDVHAHAAKQYQEAVEARRAKREQAGSFRAPHGFDDER